MHPLPGFPNDNSWPNLSVTLGPGCRHSCRVDAEHFRASRVTATTTSLLSPSSQPLATVDLFSTLSVCHSKNGVYMASCVCNLLKLAFFHSARDSPCVTELQLVLLSFWVGSRGVGRPQLVEPFLCWWTSGLTPAWADDKQSC